MKTVRDAIDVITVTLNPAIDETVTIPNFTAGQVNRVEHIRSNPGGKGVNVASTLADYGLAVAATGFLGRENPSSFETLFAEKHIADHFIRVAGHTRVGIKITDPTRQETTDINFPGLAPSPHDLDALHAELDRLSEHSNSWFVLAGSVPPGVDPTIYRELTARLKAQGCKVALDTSGEPLRHALDAAPHFIKPNVHELESLLGKPLSDIQTIIQAGKNLVARGIELVVISIGADGACFLTSEDVVIARSPQIEITSTVGAGDAMVSGVIASRLTNLPLEECARLASGFSLDLLSRQPGGRSSRESISEATARIVTERPESVFRS